MDRIAGVVLADNFVADLTPPAIFAFVSAALFTGVAFSLFLVSVVVWFAGHAGNSFSNLFNLLFSSGHSFITSLYL